MSTDAPLCALCGTRLTKTHHGALEAWVCPTGHGLGVVATESAPLSQELWERGEAAAAGIRHCPRCETAMAVVSAHSADEETPAVKVDLCPSCRVLWFDSNELAGLTGPSDDETPAHDDSALKARFGEPVDADADGQLGERLIGFAGRRPAVVRVLRSDQMQSAL
jgi:Zn-finger nucleic acid-binding protein